MKRIKNDKLRLRLGYGLIIGGLVIIGIAVMRISG